jgi:hypothetical protein
MSKYSYKPSYTFTPGVAGAGTINLLAAPGFDIRNLFSVVNITTGNASLYLAGIPGFGATVDATGYVLTLAQDTSSMSAADTLLFVYDEGEDNLNDLLAYATDRSDPDNSLGTGTKGLYIRYPKGDDMSLKNWAEQRITNVLLQQLLGDNSDLDSLLNEIVKANT